MQTGDVAAANGKLTNFSQTLNEDGLKVSRVFPTGTILVTIAANIGDVAITTFDVAAPDSLVAIQAHSDVYQEWLFYYLQTKKNDLDRAATQNAQKNINLQVLRPLPILLPPLSEQRKIAEILSTWHETIDLTQQLIAAKQRRKKALMQQLLTGRVRFPGFEGEWYETRLESVADLFFSNVDKVIDPEESSVRLCNYMDVYKNYYITNELPFMVGSANENEIKKYALFKDDVIITKDSETPDDIANAAVVTEDLENTVCGYHLAVIRPNKKELDGTFLMHYLHHPAVNNQFARLANGVTRYGLTTNSVKHAKLRIPSLPEQRRIAAVLQACDEEIDLLQQKLAALQTQKKGLMQQLLTGKVRVRKDSPPSGGS